MRRRRLRSATQPKTGSALRVPDHCAPRAAKAMAATTPGRRPPRPWPRDRQGRCAGGRLQQGQQQDRELEGATWASTPADAEGRTGGSEGPGTACPWTSSAYRFTRRNHAPAGGFKIREAGKSKGRSEPNEKVIQTDPRIVGSHRKRGESSPSPCLPKSPPLGKPRSPPQTEPPVWPRPGRGGSCRPGQGQRLQAAGSLGPGTAGPGQGPPANAAEPHHSLRIPFVSGKALSAQKRPVPRSVRTLLSDAGHPGCIGRPGA